MYKEWLPGMVTLDLSSARKLSIRLAPEQIFLTPKNES